MTFATAREALMEALNPIAIHGPITAEQIAATIARIHAAEEAFDAAITAERHEFNENTPVPFPEFR